MSKHLLFVYGTLRRCGANEISKSYPGAAFVGDSSVRGRLYDMGGYPAIILDDAAGAVPGEIYEVDDVSLAALDRFEAADEYHREQFDVQLNGGTTRCWIYRPHPDLCSGKAVVEGNDWIEYSLSADELSPHLRQDLP